MSVPAEAVAAETSAPLSLHDELAAGFSGETQETPSSTTAEASARVNVSGEQNAVPPLEAPKHWSDVDKSIFGKAPREIQQRWIERESETARGLDAKYQEIAGFRREREAYDELLKPYARELELGGISKPQFLGSLLAGHKYLQESPYEALKWIATTYGIDLAKLNEQPREVNPDIRKLEQELNSVRGSLQGWVNQAQAQERASSLNKINSFAEAKDEGGKPLHPYFDEVSSDVLALLKTMPDGQRDLEKAYQKAVRMNDAVWEKIQTEKNAAGTAAADRQRKLDIEKAKRATAGAESGVPAGQSRKLTLEEELAAQFENWSGR